MTSVSRMTTMTTANGVKARRPPSRIVNRSPCYASVIGANRGRIRTVRRSETSASV
jgi:hypothetical protein